MHLLEAAVGWMAVDQDPAWKSLADEILDLCLTRFIDPESGVLGEHFTARWDRILQTEEIRISGSHQYEWAWLLGLYQGLTGKDLTAVRTRLFERSEKCGISPDHRAYDQMWSDFPTLKLKSSRFWPQCERV